MFKVLSTKLNYIMMQQIPTPLTQKVSLAPHSVLTAPVRHADSDCRMKQSAMRMQ